MIKNFKILIFLLFMTHFCAAQTETEIGDNFPFSLLVQDFENLNHGSQLVEKYPVLKIKGMHSIIGCIYLLEMEEVEIREVAIARLIGISTQLFNEGKPIILTYGMDSSNFALEENENLEDDNHIVYLSIADCIVRTSEVESQKAFNDHTMKLIAQKRN